MHINGTSYDAIAAQDYAAWLRALKEMKEEQRTKPKIRQPEEERGKEDLADEGYQGKKKQEHPEKPPEENEEGSFRYFA